MPAWHSLRNAGGTTVVALAAIVFLWLTWTIVYRIFFHPLAKYPGPLLARVTNLYSAYHAWRGDIHLDIWRCHQTYGQRVRYAPNRLVINTSKALHDIYGHSAKVTKFKGYHFLASQAPNTLTLSDKAQHAPRRRVISQAFSENSLRLFEPAQLSRINRFCQVLRSHRQPAAEWTVPLDMAQQFDRLMFDVMTSVAFNADYRTMEEPKFRYVMEAIAAANIRLGVIMQLPELTTFRLDRSIFRESTAAGARFVKFLRILLSKRLERHSESKDIFSFLQQCKDPDTGEGLSTIELSTETATFIVAGSDTTSTTMAAVSYYLSGSPRCYKRAAEEVRRTFQSVEEIRLGHKLNSCVFLRACIDEAMRLTPPGGSSLWREVERGGSIIGDDFIPEGCEVGVGVYAIHHNPDYWKDPFSYKPERWLKDTDGLNRNTDNKQTYVPFNIGSRSCVGKPLALAQQMLTYARLLWEFDFRRAADDKQTCKIKGEDDDDVPLTEYVLKDHLTGQNQGPVLRFRARF
ncbi:cytochrome P450 [Xylaria curta]|nr:cytochrome P450 [Xylaria curta]